MYNYYWYLVHKKDFPKFKDCPGKWLLVSPDFPEICIADKDLDTRTWRNSVFIVKALDIVKKELEHFKEPFEGQGRMPEYFAFRITIPE